MTSKFQIQKRAGRWADTGAVYTSDFLIKVPPSLNFTFQLASFQSQGWALISACFLQALAAQNDAASLPLRRLGAVLSGMAAMHSTDQECKAIPVSHHFQSLAEHLTDYFALI